MALLNTVFLLQKCLRLILELYIKRDTATYIQILPLQEYPIHNYITSTFKREFLHRRLIKPLNAFRKSLAESCIIFTPYSHSFSPPTSLLLSRSCGSLLGYIFTQLILDASV
jgi:hypothetical protein